MFCSKCGSEISDQSIVCPSCGCPTDDNAFVNPQSQSTTAPKLESGESTALATCAMVFAFLMPVVGLICGIIGAVKYESENLKKKCVIAIPISIVSWIFFAFMFSV